MSCRASNWQIAAPPHFACLLLVLSYGYIEARTDTTQQSGQTPDKEVEIKNITFYISGYNESDTTRMLSRPTVWRSSVAADINSNAFDFYFLICSLPRLLCCVGSGFNVGVALREPSNVRISVWPTEQSHTASDTTCFKLFNWKTYTSWPNSAISVRNIQHGPRITWHFYVYVYMLLLLSSDFCATRYV